MAGPAREALVGKMIRAARVPVDLGRRTVRAAISGRFPIVSMALMTVFVLAAVLAPVMAPHSPTKANLSVSLQPPVWQGGTGEYILGTDKLGRDILTRIMYGARTSLTVAALSIAGAGVLGTAAGLVAGYYRGWVEALIMRWVDIMLSVPPVLLALLFAVTWGASFAIVLTVIMVILWAPYARLVHAETLSVRERDYILAAHAVGAPAARILVLHIAPNLLNTVVVLATLQVGIVVLLEAGLSFLGVGIPPPTASWGIMVSDGRQVLEKAWWVATVPGITLSLLILSVNFLGDWLRDFTDPTLRHSAK